MSNPSLLLLRLEGPMQSWGLRARWNVRDTGEEPTKSGVIGMIGCALGYPIGDPRLVTELESNLKIGIRVEQRGTPITDFHTISGRLPTADGGYKGSSDNPYTDLSYRTYLNDAAFLVVLEAPEDILIKITNALNNPKWPVYLGRKSCPPTRPLFEKLTTEYSSRYEALKKYSWNDVTGKKRPDSLKCILEEPFDSMDDFDGESTRSDIVQISPVRMYGSRQVRIKHIDIPVSTGGKDVPVKIDT